jgi:Type VI secretion system/phage-baseplate injector OB domain
MATKYFGKYRGVVTNNADPFNEGRIQVLVPTLDPVVSMWAQACIAPGTRGLFNPPDLGTDVWIEFEEGDLQWPIWVGLRGTTRSMTDSIVLAHSGGARVILDQAGIVVDNGKGATIRLSGPTVDVNNGAFTVT